MIRVAQVMGYMNGGGVESVVLNYYRCIDRSNIQFDFLVCEGSKWLPYEEIEALGGRIYIVPPYRELFRYMRELESLFRKECWPIVHSHVNSLSVFPLRAAKRAGVPIRISHSHSSSGRGKGEVIRDAAKIVLRHFSNIYPTHRFACGERAGKWLFGDASFVLVPNAIDLSSFSSSTERREMVRQELGVTKDTFVVGHIGRMAPQKNHKKLLEIFAVLRSIVPESVLVLVGDGPLMDPVRKSAIDLGISDHVRFLGHRNDAARLIQAFDVFCLPSVYEGVPVVAIESQAAEIPILVSTAVSSEVAVTSLLQFESLESSNEQWARHLLSMKGKKYTSGDKGGMKRYDIFEAAGKLEAKYCSFYRQSFLLGGYTNE